MRLGLGFGVMGVVILLLAVSCSDRELGSESATGSGGRTPGAPTSPGRAGAQPGGDSGSAGTTDSGGVGGSAGADPGSGGGGTPVAVRRVYAEGQVVINEVRILPEVDQGVGGEGGSVGLATNPGSFVELHNRTDEPLALTVCQVNDQDLENAVDDDLVVIPAHGYALIATDLDCCGNARVDALVPTLRPTIYHTSDQLQMKLGCGSQLVAGAWQRWFQYFPVPSEWLSGRSFQVCEGAPTSWSKNSGSPGAANDCP